MSRNTYPSDLSDRQWQLLEPLIPPEKPRGKRRSVDLREIVNGIFDLLHNGCTWRALPHDLPPWQTVSTYLYRWQRQGVWEQLNATFSSSKSFSQRALADYFVVCDTFIRLTS